MTIKLGDTICYGLDEVAALLKISRRAVCYHLQDGTLTATRIGRSKYVSHTDLEEFWEKLRARQAAARRSKKTIS